MTNRGRSKDRPAAAAKSRSMDRERCRIDVLVRGRVVRARVGRVVAPACVRPSDVRDAVRVDRDPAVVTDEAERARRVAEGVPVEHVRGRSRDRHGRRPARAAVRRAGAGDRVRVVRCGSVGPARENRAPIRADPGQELVARAAADRDRAAPARTTVRRADVEHIRVRSVPVGPDDVEVCAVTGEGGEAVIAEGRARERARDVIDRREDPRAERRAAIRRRGVRDDVAAT